MKSLMYSYGRMFEILLSQGEAKTGGEVADGQLFEGGIIVQPESSRSLYYIFPNATRYKFLSREQLRDHGLEEVHIHVEVPYEVISAFPLTF